MLRVLGSWEKGKGKPSLLLFSSYNHNPNHHYNPNPNHNHHYNYNYQNHYNYHNRPEFELSLDGITLPPFPRCPKFTLSPPRAFHGLAATPPPPPPPRRSFHRRKPGPPLSSNVRRILAAIQGSKTLELEPSLGALRVGINHFNVSQVLKQLAAVDGDSTDANVNADKMVAFFRWAEREPDPHHHAHAHAHDSYAYNALVRGLGKARRFAEAWDLLAEMETKAGLALTDAPFNALIRSYGEAGMKAEAEETLRQMKQRNVAPTDFTYGTLVAVFATSLGEPETALGFYKEKLAEGHPPNDISFNVVVEALCKGGKLDIAWDAFKYMHERGIRPNVYCWTSLLAGFSRSGKMQENVLLLFSEMMRWGVAPNERTYGVVIRGLCKEGRMDIALQLHQSMRGGGNDENGGSRKIEPDRATNNCIINALCDVGRLEDALTFFEEIIESDGRIYPSAYYTLVQSLHNAGWTESVLELQNRLVGPGFPGDDPIALEDFADCLTKPGKIEKAFDIFTRHCNNSGFLPSAPVHNLLVQGLSRVNRAADADSVFRSRRKGSKIVTETCFELIRSLCKAGLLRAAVDDLGQMLAEGFKVSTCTCNVLIHAVCCSNQMASALKIVDGMGTGSSPLPDSVTFHTLIHSYALAGNLELTLSYFDEMLRRGFTPDTQMFEPLIGKLCLSNKVNLALQIFQALRRGGKASVPSIATYTSLLQGLSKDGKFEEACDVFLDYTSDYKETYHFVVYKMLLFAFHDCDSSLGGINKDKAAGIYQSLIRKLAGTGKTIEAGKILSEISKTGLAECFANCQIAT